MIKKIFILFIVIVSLVLGYNYIYKAGRNIAKEEPLFKTNSVTLKKEFTKNQDSIIKKYLDKTIQVSGRLTAISKNNIVMDNFIAAELIDKSLLITKGDMLIIKGRVIGYDDLLGEFKLDQGTIISKK